MHFEADQLSELGEENVNMTRKVEKPILTFTGSNRLGLAEFAQFVHVLRQERVL